VNGSRGHLREAQERYPTLLPVLLTVKDEVLRERLLRRGRETREQIDQRLARNALFTERRSSNQAVFQLDNSGDLADAVEQLLDWIRISAAPDQT
jgi:ribose 1,5-bisphosphokinase